MKKIFHRTLPVLALAALLCTSTLPASALLFGAREELTASAVLTFSKNAPASETIRFIADDFQVEGEAALDAIVLSDLPALSVGVMTLHGRQAAVGDIVTMSAISGLQFIPASPLEADTAFSFTPVFSDGATGVPVTVSLHLLAEANSAPVAENLELSTYKNVALTAQFSATDPEGDLLTFQMVSKPARGAITMPEAGSNEFVYTPYENKTGKDSFTYVAVDTVGNTSAPATVKLRIEKASTKVTYADMNGVPAYKAAIRLAEQGIYVGENMGGQYFFQPETPVSRGTFVTMAMRACGVDALEGIDRTGFADDAFIPTWCKPYVSSALKAGLIQGSANGSGQVVFQADSTITKAEASVLLDRMLQISDVSTPTLYFDSDSVPTWAYQSAVNLETCGVLRTDGTGALALNETLTRADAAELLCGALEVLDARDTGGWFKW